MDFFVAVHSRYILLTLQIFVSISLILAGTGVKGRYGLKSMSDLALTYFFSFSPVAMLAYVLYKISGMN